MSSLKTNKMTNYRWVICAMLFFATTVNYMDRQVLSLTWKDFIAPEFHWTDAHYGDITAWFSIFYAVGMLFAGRFVDWMGTKKGFLWAIGVWSFGACAHALCGVGTEWIAGYSDKAAMIAETSAKAVLLISTTSVWLFLAARFVLAIGEAGNFPAAIKVTAEYFPKKDRAFATSVFNLGATVGALIAPLTIPVLAKYFGWEMAFIVIGALGFVWMGFWVNIYKKPADQPESRLNKAELMYIEQDNESAEVASVQVDSDEPKIGFLKCFTFPQTWSFFVGKFMTDGVWWFFLFWTPAYISDVYGYSSDSFMGMILIFMLYAITMLSLYGGKLPTIIINKTGKNPYAARMQAMLIFAFIPLVGLVAQPLGQYSCWLPIIIIGFIGAAHQSWSANIFSTIGDMFPKSIIATITGIGGMAGGIGSFMINKGAGSLFSYSAGTCLYKGEELEMSTKLLKEVAPKLDPEVVRECALNGQKLAEQLMAAGCEIVQAPMEALGFIGKPAGYMIVFCFCAVAYLIGWVIMKTLVPKYKPIVIEK